MKKTILSMLVFLLLAGSVLAVGDNAQGTPNDNSGQPDGMNLPNNPEGMADSPGQLVGEEKIQGAGTPELIMEKVQTMDQLKTQVQTKTQEMQKEMEGMSESQKKVYQNQNQVREAVHTLQQMEGLTGGIGPQVSEVAKHFDNSVQATIQAEEKIQAKSGFSRFIGGGDKETGQALEQEVNQNMEKIQELKQLSAQCDCDDAVKTMLQEQIQNMEQEQNRLQELAQKEQKSKGLLGWLWK